MIKRVWHGWTTPENADAYVRLLQTDVFPTIEAKNIHGFRGIELLRWDQAGEVEFATIMMFESFDDVVAFQGKGRDFDRSYIPEAARKLLTRWDNQSAHYEVVDTRTYP